jgi:soluble lytic murein transglycosylase-like protein
MARYHARDLWLARRAKRHGAAFALRIVLEARRAGIPISLAFALVEQESGFRNVFGHDAGAWRPDDGRVTAGAVRELLRRVKAGQPSNGVGLTQLTWPPFIHQAGALGGAHIPKYQLRVGFTHLAGLLRHYHHTSTALSAYNAGDPNSRKGKHYAAQVLNRAKKWHFYLD